MIGYAGLSHLGLISSLAAAAKDFAVVGYDADAALVTDAVAGRFRVSEPGLQDLFSSVRARVHYAADPSALADCAVVYISVDVPTDVTGRSDSSPVLDLVRTVCAVTRPGTIIVVLSQVSPGFTRQLAPVVQATGHRLYYQVETLIFGRAVERALRPERFVVGCLDAAAAIPEPLNRFLRAFDCPILPMRMESAELTKIAINVCLVSSISTTNMLSEVCEAIGANWEEIVPALRLDARIGPKAYLSPGLGFGGGNLGRDLETIKRISAEYGTDTGIIDAWRENSRYRRDWLLRTLHSERLSRGASCIGIWGLSYKEDTAETKNSPALALIESIPHIAVRAYDPQAHIEATRFRQLTVCSSALDAAAGADVLVIATPWSEFKSVSATEIRRRMRGTLVIDPYGVMARAACRAAGLRQRRLGVPEES